VPVGEIAVGDSKAAAPVVLSPHLDDAVLSVWHVLTAPGPIDVTTVFAGIPEPGFVTPLDGSHGAEESASWMRQRRIEDRNALRLAGRVPRHFELLDIQYVVHRDPELGRMVADSPRSFVALVRSRIELEARVAEIASVLPPESLRGRLVYAPMSLGGHPDHRAVALYALRLAANGIQVRLWADSPYFLRHGLPTWLAGEVNHPADEIIGEGVSVYAGHRFRLSLRTIRLTGARLDRKIEAVREYTTEYRSLQASFGRALEPEYLAYEAMWSLAV
jgi:hypothetical protein